VSDPADFYRMKNKVTGECYDYSALLWDLIVVPVVFCKCAEPFLKTWTDGRVFCTRCGHLTRLSEQQSAPPSEVKP
jgi:hypothetical protein